MDNVTHTLIGVLLGETAARHAPPAKDVRYASIRRGLFLSVMVVGSNIPDCDLLYSLGSYGKLRYLLEHRGHTHTVIGALFESAVVLAACALWLRWRRATLESSDRVWLVTLAVVAPLLHIGMDAFNTYGVHPWWPFDNRWFYGDSVFIVEPLLWAATAPLALLLRSYVARGLVVLALLGGLYLAFTSGLVTRDSIVLYCALVVLMLAIGWKAQPRAALLASIGVCLATTVTFTIAGRQVASALDAYAEQNSPQWTTLDHVLSPMPMNPMCWEVILVQADGDRYALRRGIASLAPSTPCPTRSVAQAITAPSTNVALPDTPFLHWYGEVIGSRDEIRALAATSCEVAAFLRFARTPWLIIGSARKVIGDLRYDREPGLGFAEIDLDRSSRCPAYVPPWIPPRRDLLE